jgi:peptide deformylase
MTVLAVLQETDPLLRMISDPIEAFDDGLRDLAFNMAETIAHHRALGLSAIQVCVPLRLCLVRIYQSGVSADYVAMANPKLVRTLARTVVMAEGCLSIGEGYPRRHVERPAKCEVEWQDLEGNRKTGNFTGWEARCVLHELDHLDGKLMIDLPRARG